MSPIANQNIAKLHHYDNPRLNTEFERIYNFLQFTRYPRESIDGEALEKGSVHETKLILPLSSEAAPGIAGILGKTRTFVSTITISTTSLTDIDDVLLVDAAVT